MKVTKDLAFNKLAVESILSRVVHAQDVPELVRLIQTKLLYTQNLDQEYEDKFRNLAINEASRFLKEKFSMKNQHYAYITNYLSLIDQQTLALDYFNTLSSYQMQYFKIEDIIFLI